MRTIFICIILAISHLAFSQSYTQWVERAADFIEADKPDSAVVALQRAMLLEPANPNNPVLLLNLGILQRHIGLYDAAYNSFTASLNINPGADLVLYNRASLLNHLGRFDEAMEDYTTILRLNPEETEALYRRGVLFLERNDRASAEADFRAAERINPNDFYTKLSRALLHKLDDEWEEAKDIYTQLINSSATPNHALYLNRAECYVHIGRYAEAAADLRVIESSQRENAFFYFLRGRVRLAQFDKMGARNDFLRAKELGYFEDIVEDWLERVG